MRWPRASCSSGLDPDPSQPLIIGILNWAAEWWSPKRSCIGAVVATARSIIRHGVAAVLARGGDPVCLVKWLT